jgi:hypothetical protein
VDLAVIVLQNKINLIYPPARLFEGSISDVGNHPEYINLVIAGFGLDGASNVECFGVLRTNDNVSARHTLPCTYRVFGENKIGTCSGDSGGPLYYREENGELKLAGISTTGMVETCTKSNYVDHFQIFSFLNLFQKK